MPFAPKELRRIASVEFARGLYIRTRIYVTLYSDEQMGFERGAIGPVVRPEKARKNRVQVKEKG